MATILFLAHRLPYPPNKGDKIRAFHLLRHFASRHRVKLGTFVDDPNDEVHIDTLRSMCVDVQVVRLHPGFSRVCSLRGLVSGEALSVEYYRNREMRRWAEGLSRRGDIDAVFVFSSPMIQYALQFKVPMVVDFCDVDSVKWAEYGRQRAWPMSKIYSLEGHRLLSYERAGAALATRSLFATENEAAIFRQLAPEAAARITVLGNGVDAQYFAPVPGRPSPYLDGELAMTFVGAMDYWPNVDAVGWFATEVLPLLRARFPGLRLYIVGRGPTAAVRALAGPAVCVTGSVEDVRPYVQHAAVVVAPLRIARGIQNKVLEAMAMGRPVVAATACVESIDAVDGEHLLSAASAEDYVNAISSLLSSPERGVALGIAAQERVRAVYGWESRLAGLDGLLSIAPKSAERPADR